MNPCSMKKSADWVVSTTTRCAPRTPRLLQQIVHHARTGATAAVALAYHQALDLGAAIIEQAQRGAALYGVVDAVHVVVGQPFGNVGRGPRHQQSRIDLRLNQTHDLRDVGRTCRFDVDVLIGVEHGADAGGGKYLVDQNAVAPPVHDVHPVHTSATGADRGTDQGTAVGAKLLPAALQQTLGGAVVHAGIVPVGPRRQFDSRAGNGSDSRRGPH